MFRSWDSSSGDTAAVNSAAAGIAGIPLLLALFLGIVRHLFFPIYAACRTPRLPFTILEASPEGFDLPLPQARLINRDLKVIQAF